MSDTADVKNFLTADQLSIPKKHYHSQSWRTNTVPLKVSHTSSISKSDASYLMMTSDYKENITQANIDIQGVSWPISSKLLHVQPQNTTQSFLAKYQGKMK